MSDAPRTDSMQRLERYGKWWVPEEDARQLERELAAKTHRLAELALLANNRLQKLENAEREVAELRGLWERDSAALGKCLQELHTLRAVKEDQRARIAVLEREVAELHGDVAELRDALELARSWVATRLSDTHEDLQKIDRALKGKP